MSGHRLSGSPPQVSAEAKSEPARPAARPEQAILLYDSDCRFCCICAAALLSWDRARRLRPEPLGTEEADRLLSELPPEVRGNSYHLVRPDGTVFSAGPATPALLRLLPGGSPIAALLEAMPASTQRAYRFIADHRTVPGPYLPTRLVEWARRVLASRA